MGLTRRKEREANIERRADRWAKEHGIKFRKMNGAGQRSWPDKLYLLPNGVAAFVEFKKRGERPTKLQAQMLADLTALRQHARWFDNSDDAIAWLSQLLQLRRRFGRAVSR